MVKVTFIHPDLGIGGAERLVVDAGNITLPPKYSKNSSICIGFIFQLLAATWLSYSLCQPLWCCYSQSSPICRFGFLVFAKILFVSFFVFVLCLIVAVALQGQGHEVTIYTAHHAPSKFNELFFWGEGVNTVKFTGYEKMNE